LAVAKLTFVQQLIRTTSPRNTAARSSHEPGAKRSMLRRLRRATA
jgi:hypothetical protein